MPLMKTSRIADEDSVSKEIKYIRFGPAMQIYHRAGYATWRKITLNLTPTQLWSKL
jgi:hypothetical protein